MVWSGHLRGGGAQEVPDLAGEVALEAADGVAGGLAVAAAAFDVIAGGLVAAGAGDDDAMQRGVDLAVAAPVQALAAGVAWTGGGWGGGRRPGGGWGGGGGGGGRGLPRERWPGGWARTRAGA